jgi:hypothetical protein
MEYIKFGCKEKESEFCLSWTGILEFCDAAISRNHPKIAEFSQFKSRNLNFGKVIFFNFPLNSQKDTLVWSDTRRFGKI